MDKDLILKNCFESSNGRSELGKFLTSDFKNFFKSRSQDEILFRDVWSKNVDREISYHMSFPAFKIHKNNFSKIFHSEYLKACSELFDNFNSIKDEGFKELYLEVLPTDGVQLEGPFVGYNLVVYCYK